MASTRKRQPEEEPPALELEEPDEVFEQEVAMGEIEDEVKPRRAAGPRPRRTAKTRAPKQSSTAPPPRQRAPRRDPGSRRDPRQLSLFSRLAPERVSNRVTGAGSSILISLLAISGLVVLFYLFASSQFFALKGVDVRWPEVKLGGETLMSAAEVEAIVRPKAEVGVLRADLEKIRETLKKDPLIREAEVARLLPDRLRVSIIERRPVALAIRGGVKTGNRSVVCVDDEGVMFGDGSHWRKKPWPPLISGLAESGGDVKEEDAKAINRQWILTYKNLMAELDQTQPPMSSRIDEIQFDKDQGVALTLADSRVAVRIGREDFRTRLNTALDILDAVRRKDLDALNVLRISDAERLLTGKILYLNVNDPKRPVAGFEE
ncbi:MAG TPA: FtsQ-type POTRA domain-containing protein [Blastocatellia bacterium]|nr:FtsQ-type POTRA domain-containing protein [Blastocatellia bacterium]